MDFWSICKIHNPSQHPHFSSTGEIGAGCRHGCELYSTDARLVRCRIGWSGSFAHLPGASASCIITRSLLPRNHYEPTVNEDSDPQEIRLSIIFPSFPHHLLIIFPFHQAQPCRAWSHGRRWRFTRAPPETFASAAWRPPMCDGQRRPSRQTRRGWEGFRSPSSFSGTG